MHTCMHKFSKKILIYFSLGVFAFKDSISFIMSMNLHKLASDSPVQGKSPPVQVKEPYGNFDMVTCRLSSCNPECTMYTCR